MGLLNSMKSEIQKSGGSKGKILFIKDGSKKRIRFLCDAEEGMELTFHDSYSEGINALCLEEMGKDCPYCERDELRTRKLYAWSVWDYDSKEVKVLLYAANNCTPIPNIIAMYEAYGTLLDRDFVISRTGSGQNTSYTVIPQDKAKFKNSKAVKMSKKELLKVVAKAFPVNPDDEDFEDEGKKKKSSKKPPKKSGKKRDEDYDDDYEEEDKEDEDFDEEEDEEEEDYEDMSAKELFNLCKKRGLKVEKGKKKSYYIDILEDADDEEDEEDDEDEWDD